MSESEKVYHLVRTALGVDKWREHVPSLVQMADLPSLWPERHSDPKLRQHLKAFEKLNMSQFELIHPSQAECMSPISLRLFDKSRLKCSEKLVRTSPPERHPEEIDSPRSIS